MRIAMASDHAGRALKDEIKALLMAGGHEVTSARRPMTRPICRPGLGDVGHHDGIERHLRVEVLRHQRAGLRPEPPGVRQLMHGDRRTVRGQQRSRCGLVRAGGLPLPPLGRAGHDGCHLAGVTHTDHLAGQRAEGAKIGVGALPGLDFTECRSAFMAGDLQRYVAHTCTSRGGSGSATTR